MITPSQTLWDYKVVLADLVLLIVKAARVGSKFNLLVHDAGRDGDLFAPRTDAE